MKSLLSAQNSALPGRGVTTMQEQLTWGRRPKLSSALIKLFFVCFCKIVTLPASRGAVGEDQVRDKCLGKVLAFVALKQ